MKHIYIAGPFSGANAWEIEQNIQCAEAYILPIAKLGAVPVCPHTMYRNFDGTLPYERWIEITVALLTKCDAILMTLGWEQSSGSCGEFRQANRMDIPIFLVDDRWNARARAWVNA